MDYLKNTLKKLSGYKTEIQNFDKDKDGKLSEQELEEYFLQKIH